MARSLQSQAFGTKKFLEALKESGSDIPQETIDLFAEQEKEYEEEANRLTIGGILCLSPLHLPSPFLNENVLAAIDPYGLNATLIDAGTAATLQTPTSSQGDHAIERSNEPTGRDLEGLSVQERGDVSGVDRTEDASKPTTAPAVPDPGPAALNLTVREESSVSTLGVGDEDPTLPLVELSDSSAEEDGGDESNELVRASNPLGTEEDLGESSAKEQGNVDKVENPPDSTADRTEDASDPLGAQVTGEEFDHAEE
ncbi:PREDICTED: uncharacterized protein LOC106334013 [Brassica oleracea var. oleracea]|uniref:uncharacterized protein LOC106334013 n=1 Tax=Brassica oleracea var. oleracea TaxID=109376 RepID=UPI0006A6E9D7|nr:PREDICTED: uncharacterized protein LOC106334013 [Brassica oleracea var. oleracea]